MKIICGNYIDQEKGSCDYSMTLINYYFDLEIYICVLYHVDFDACANCIHVVVLLGLFLVYVHPLRNCFDAI